LAAPASAAPRDRAAITKINEALALYSGQEAERAEAMLRGILKACEDRCSPAVLAKAWMYVGIVRGGQADAQGAQEAFLTAVTLDPNVELDAAMATEETQQAWTTIFGDLSDDVDDDEPRKSPAPPRTARRAPDKELCPPDFPCTCGSDADCDANRVCRAGVCAHKNRCPKGEDCTSKEPPRLWLGAHVAQDFAFMTGNDVCAPQSRGEGGFACFTVDGQEYLGEPLLGSGGKLKSGFSLATRRALLSAEYLLLSELSFGVRAGLAFGGGPPTAGSGFLPLHAEARVAAWLPLDLPVRPCAFVGAGIAQVDAELSVVVRDRAAPGRRLVLDAHRRMGRGFASTGVGALLPFGRLGIRVDVAMMTLFPTSGFAIQPTLGLAYGL
jgi:hypothetical protein